jgi:hypothetical protein
VEEGLYLAVADAPLDKYGVAALGHAVHDLEQVSRAALAHEAVVESFASATAVLPMKLFTVFASDARALAHVRERRQQIASIAERVAHHQEWGVRVLRDRPATRARPGQGSLGACSGTAYLRHRRERRDAAEPAASHEALDALYDRLAARTGLAKRRLPAQPGAPGARLLLDAAFLVPRARAASFRALASQESRRLARRGYRLSVSGPWPPYSFMQD